MRNWEDERCPADKDMEDANWVCNKLNIPFIEVNFVKEYWIEVFSYLLTEYKSACTPNPDIFCNRYIKFNHFLSYAKEKFGVDAMATGHYARSSFGPYLENYRSDEGAKLLKAKDPLKDQTFFLSQMPEQSLRQTMFPLGDLMKTEVRKIAEEENLDRISKKKDSTGICFIGKRNFSQFISEYLEDNPGNVVSIENGEIIGTHKGLHHYTLGQRFPVPRQSCKMFITERDPSTNTLYLAPGTNHPSLYNIYVYIENMVWINSPPTSFMNEGELKCQVRFQHGFLSVEGTYYKVPPKEHFKENVNFIKIAIPVRAITPGQFAVLYNSEECLGASRIHSTGPSLYGLTHTKIEAVA